jgi:hypothetical protein
LSQKLRNGTVTVRRASAVRPLEAEGITSSRLAFERVGYLAIKNPRIERRQAATATLCRWADGEGLDGLKGEGGVPLSSQPWEQIRELWADAGGRPRNGR